MVVLLALGVMNLAWMCAITGVVLLQKTTAPRAAVDRTLALAIVSLGVLVIAAPAAVPGLTPAM
jgi:predicted metal-binding membrane protein